MGRLKLVSSAKRETKNEESVLCIFNEVTETGAPAGEDEVERWKRLSVFSLSLFLLSF